MESNFKFNEFEKRLNAITAQEMMTKSVITVKKDMPLADFSEMILTKRISGVPVTEDSGKIIGIITATDLFTLIQMLKSGQIQEDGKQGVCNPTVDFAMSREVICVKKETTLNEIIVLMLQRNIHTLPVKEGAKLLGIIGRRDVMKYFYSIVKQTFGA